MNDQEKIKKYATGAFAAIIIMYVASEGICWNNWTLYAPAVTAEWGVSRAQFMMVVTIMSMINSLFSLFAYGWVQSKMSIKKMLLIGTIFSSISIALYATSHSMTQFYVAALFYGFGVATQSSTTGVLILTSWFKKRAGSKFGIAHTFGNFAGIISTSLFGYLINTFGWRIPLFITLAISIIDIIAIQALYKGTPEELGLEIAVDDGSGDAAHGSSDYGLTRNEMLRSPQFYMLAVGYMLVCFAGYGAFSNLTLFATDRGFGNVAGTFLSVALVGAAATNALWGKIIDKFGTKIMVSCCMVLCSVAMLLLRVENLPIAGLYAIAVLLGAGYPACLLPAGISITEVFGEKEHGKKVGIIVGISFLAFSFAPTVMAAFYDITGSYDSALLVFVLFAIAAAALIFCATRKPAYE